MGPKGSFEREIRAYKPNMGCKYDSYVGFGGSHGVPRAGFPFVLTDEGFCDQR